ncbi:glycoside hydrolase family 38 N-terminal domain-containing protein, partial [Streptomyces sp. NPDC003388]
MLGAAVLGAGGAVLGLPGAARAAGVPHHTFHWEGIDGTRIFTHFPPVDTYNCSMR